MYKDGIGKYTNINGKNLTLSSLSNLVLFLLKPSFSNIGKKTKKSLCQPLKGSKTKESKNVVVNGNKYLITSISVYKKPYFQWNNVDIDTDIDHENDNGSKEKELAVIIGSCRSHDQLEQ